MINAPFKYIFILTFYFELIKNNNNLIFTLIYVFLNGLGEGERKRKRQDHNTYGSSVVCIYNTSHWFKAGSLKRDGVLRTKAKKDIKNKTRMKMLSI